MKNVQQYLTNPSWEMILPLVLFAVLFFYGLYRGHRRLAAIIIYTYVALAVFAVLPMQKITGFLVSLGVKEWEAKAGVFVILLLLLAFLLGTRKNSRFSLGSWWQVFLFSVLQAGLLAHIILGFLPPEKMDTLSPAVRRFLAGPDYNLWWVIVPIAIVVIVRRMERREG